MKQGMGVFLSAAVPPLHPWRRLSRLVCRFSGLLWVCCSAPVNPGSALSRSVATVRRNTGGSPSLRSRNEPDKKRNLARVPTLVSVSWRKKKRGIASDTGGGSGRGYRSRFRLRFTVPVIAAVAVAVTPSGCAVLLWLRLRFRSRVSFMVTLRVARYMVEGYDHGYDSPVTGSGNGSCHGHG